MNTNLKHALAISSLAVFAFTGCKDEPKAETALAEEKIPGIILENMDTSVSPKDDFYNYVNGTWLKNNTIPEDETVWGGFGILRKQTRKDVLEIVKTSKELGTYAEGTDQKKALLLFETELDTIARDKAGITPLQPYLDKINNIKNLADLQTAIASEIAISNPFMGLSSFANLSNSSMNAAYVGSGNLGLPDRDYYLDQDDKSKETRQQYVDHMVRMFAD